MGMTEKQSKIFLGASCAFFLGVVVYFLAIMGWI